jgi:hypothetical protein
MLLCPTICDRDCDMGASYGPGVVEVLLLAVLDECEALCEVSYSDRSPTWVVGGGIMDC